MVWLFYQELLGLQILQTLHRVHHWKDLYPCKYTFHRTSRDNPCGHSSWQLSRTCERLEGLLGRLLRGIFLQKQPFNRFESVFLSFQMTIFGKLIPNDSLAQILYLVHSFLVSLVQSCLLPATARNKKLNIKNSMSSGHRKLTRTENAFSVLKYVLEKILSEISSEISLLGKLRHYYVIPDHMTEKCVLFGVKIWRLDKNV